MKESSLERTFKLTWMACKGPALAQETSLVPGRKFRCDFLHQPSKTVIEIEGGAYSNGRHTRGSGFELDAEKYLLLTLLGYRVIRLAAKQVRVEWVTKIVAFLESLTKGPIDTAPTRRRVIE